MNRLENEHIICISSVDWEPLWTRKQQIMSRLPDSNRILYVEPPITLLSPFKDASCWKKWAMWRQGVRQLNDHIFLYSPPVILPFGNRFAWISRINAKLIAAGVKKAARRLSIDNPILWTYLHTSCYLASAFHEKLLVYDCVDEHSAYQGFDPDTVKAMERELLSKADIVFCTAQGLYEDKKPYSREIYHSPNGADLEHFRLADSRETPLAPEMAGIPGPILGFVGAIKEWIDLALLTEIARSHPEWSLVMVGPVGVDVDTSEMEKLPNIYFMGHQERKLLPTFLKGFDVCLNPFRLTRLTQTVSPLKFYEYLASGRPIASVPMPEIMEFDDVVEFGQGLEGFTAAIEKALDDTPQKKERRLARAGENSWESRAAFMMDKIAAHLDKAVSARSS